MRVALEALQSEARRRLMLAFVSIGNLERNGYVQCLDGARSDA